MIQGFENDDHIQYYSTHVSSQKVFEILFSWSYNVCCKHNEHDDMLTAKY